MSIKQKQYNLEAKFDNYCNFSQGEVTLIPVQNAKT